MAKQRKEYFYNPIDFNKDVAVGIKLPFGKKNGLFLKNRICSLKTSIFDDCKP